MGWCIREPQRGGFALGSASTLVRSQLLARVPVRADPRGEPASVFMDKTSGRFNITRVITSHSAHSIRQPEDGGSPRAHRPAQREPAEKLLLPRYEAVIDLGVLPATGSFRETENTSK